MMANPKKSNERSRFNLRNAGFDVGQVVYSSSSSEEDSEVTTGCRSCRNTSKEHYTTSRLDTEPLTATQPPRREPRDAVERTEVNPFSFKRFIKSNPPSSYQNTGARPKVYSPSVPTSYSLDKDNAVYTRNPTELPDFVQDHLVMEQCYLNNQSNQSGMADVDNLPDFTLNSVEQRQDRVRHDSKKLESSASCGVHLDFKSTKKVRRGLPPRNNSLPSSSRGVHLDLPPDKKIPDLSGLPSGLGVPDFGEFKSQVLKFDARLDDTIRECPGDSSVPKSLPDFLNDGPIHNRTALSVDSGTSPNISESTERRLLSEIGKLQLELQISRKQINEKNQRIQILELELARKRDPPLDALDLAPTQEYDEDSLHTNTKQDASGESVVAVLKKEIKSLTAEVSLLRGENKKLRIEMSTSGSGDCSSPNADRTIRRLAGDLRTAASSAEISLRELMSGVENLRVLASTLENADRIEDRTKDFLPDSDKDNAVGPAV